MFIREGQTSFSRISIFDFFHLRKRSRFHLKYLLASRYAQQCGVRVMGDEMMGPTAQLPWTVGAVVILAG